MCVYIYNVKNKGYMHELGCKDMEMSTNTVQIQVQIQRHEQFLKNYNKIRLIEYVTT